MWQAFKRSLAIFRVLVLYRLYEVLPRRGPLRLLPLLVRLHPAYYDERFVHEPLAVRLRLSLEALGAVFVKLGQTLSTRPDLISPELMVELSKLQDRVPPFPGAEAQRLIETALGRPIDQLFLEFDRDALASASVAQVHSARLFDGRAVVVKVLRPGVERVIAKDVALMRALAGLVNLHPEGQRLRPLEVVKEFENTLANELDLMSEAANASQLRANFAGSPLLYVPEIFWDYCRKNMLVMEKITAINIADSEALAAAGTNMKVLADRGVEIFFTQVFRDSFFHADMHPGNIFVDISNPQEPRYCAIDFGIMGSLTPEDQHYLAENFLAFFNRDYRRVAELHIESGWVPADTRVTNFESAIRKVSEPIFGRPIKDISFGAFLLSLFQTARRFNMHIQPQLVLLQKTFFNVEGLGRRLYPDLDLWTTAKPVLEDWMKTQIGPRAFLKRLRYNAHDYAKILPQLPILLARRLQETPPPPPPRHHFYGGLGCVLTALALWLLAPAPSWAQELALLLLGLYGLHLLRRAD